MARHVVDLPNEANKTWCTAFFPPASRVCTKRFWGRLPCRELRLLPFLAATNGLGLVLETSLQARGETQFPRLFGQRDWPLAGVAFKQVEDESGLLFELKAVKVHGTDYRDGRRLHRQHGCLSWGYPIFVVEKKGLKGHHEESHHVGVPYPPKRHPHQKCLSAEHSLSWVLNMGTLVAFHS